MFGIFKKAADVLFMDKDRKFVLNQIKQGNLVIDPGMSSQDIFLTNLFKYATPPKLQIDNPGQEIVWAGLGSRLRLSNWVEEPVVMTAEELKEHQTEAYAHRLEQKRRELACVSKARGDFLKLVAPQVKVFMDWQIAAGRVSFPKDVGVREFLLNFYKIRAETVIPSGP